MFLDALSLVSLGGPDDVLLSPDGTDGVDLVLCRVEGANVDLELFGPLELLELLELRLPLVESTVFLGYCKNSSLIVMSALEMSLLRSDCYLPGKCQRHALL